MYRKKKKNTGHNKLQRGVRATQTIIIHAIYDTDI